MFTMKAPAKKSGFFTASIADGDAEVADAIGKELGRQQHEIELIASENIVSKAVLEAAGTVLTNKYAEGYPGKRYYGGCQYVDIVEQLAIDRAKKLFGCGFANVQPHSGSQANQGVFNALAAPGDTILGLSLAAGGHLTHGSPVNQSGKWFKAVSYMVKPDTHRINMDEVYKLALEHRPRIIIAGGSAYPRHIEFADFRAIANEVGAYLMVDMAHFAGLVAGGAHPSPFPHAHVVTTTTHKTLRGPRGGMILTNDEDIAKKVNSAIFPGIQGGPLMHIIAAKAVAFGEALRPDFKVYAKNVIENAKAMGEVLVNSRLRARLRRHRHAPDPARPAPQEAHREYLGEGAGTRQHHDEQERRALRSGEADGHLGHPPRRARRHHARLRRRRVPGGRPHDRGGAGRARQEWRGRQRRGGAEGQGAGDRALQALPDLHLISHKPIRGVRSCPLDIRGHLVAF